MKLELSDKQWSDIVICLLNEATRIDLSRKQNDKVSTLVKRYSNLASHIHTEQKNEKI